jgi:hypothetical protein
MALSNPNFISVNYRAHGGIMKVYFTACQESILLVEHTGSMLSCLLKEVYIAHVIVLLYLHITVYLSTRHVSCT